VQFFFDESVHDSGGFILGAWAAFSASPEALLSERLRIVGVSPSLEFHSAARMDRDHEMRKLRDAMRSVLSPNVRIGAAVVPRDERAGLGVHALRCLKQTLEQTGLIAERHEYYLDQGLFRGQAGDAAVHGLELNAAGEFHFEQDSSRVRGIQFADLIAQNCALMLKDSLGLLRKTVRAGEDSGYDPDLMIELGFELWATVRYCFFGKGPEVTVAQIEEAKDLTELLRVTVGKRGLYVASTCSERLRTAAESRFGSMYIGCIH
jgi:hypothetical protein